MTSSPVVEGLFAIHKPPGITSAQVIRNVQWHFKPSALFKSWLEEEAARLNDARKHHHKARFRKNTDTLNVKIGHGGTLDPLATGVLILGVGSGTKKLGDFLACTKSYDTVVLFGQATETYDVVGKTVARKPFDHITREKVEEALKKFRGKFMQKPPIFSARRVQGKHLYEYAREGKEVPVEIEERPVTVENLELVEWFEGGSHPYDWPRDEANEEEKRVAEKVLHINNVEPIEQESKLKRGREDDEAVHEQPVKKIKEDLEETARNVKEDPEQNTAIKEDAAATVEDPAKVGEATSPSADLAKREACPAPACRLRMTVTSGFYVRSLCHDLGEAVDSLGIMASLVRTRQGGFELGKNVFAYEDLAKGEDVWAPKIEELLKQSNA